MSADTLAYEFIQAGDLRFEVATAGDARSKKLALLLHGFPECAFSWRHQLPFLAERGYRVWAPNQRGYGNSPMPRGVKSYRLDALVGDVANLIDAAGAESVLLAGHDWGGAVAWEFALRAPRRIERLSVFNLPHPAIFREAIRTNWAQRRRSLYILFFQLPWLPELLLTRKNAALVDQAFRGMAVDKSRFPDDVLAVYRANALRPGGASAMLNWYRAAGRRFGETRGPVPVLQTPTLLVWGERDTALGKELTFGTERYVKDLTLRYLPDVSHWVQQEAPERVNEIWAAWLDGREVPGNRE
jgi:pimeloyl-ACP methyl ester carboxylesterase